MFLHPLKRVYRHYINKNELCLLPLLLWDMSTRTRRIIGFSPHAELSKSAIVHVTE